MDRFINKIICPYCKHHNDGMEDVLGVDDEYGFDYDATREMSCHKCEKIFEVEKIVVSRYRTSKV